MRLVVLYGAPEVGKLAVGRELAALIGIKLFHNHWTVNLLTAVCPPASETWNRLAPRIRLDVFHEGARVGVDLVLTSASRAADPEEVERVRTLTVMSDR